MNHNIIIMQVSKYDTQKVTGKDIKPLLQIFYYILMKIIHKQNGFC